MKFSSQFLTALFASVGAFLCGISFGWNSAVARSLQDLDLKLSKYEFQLILSNAPMTLGRILILVPVGLIRHLLGARVTLLICTASSIVGWILLALSFQTWMIITGNYLCGCAAGGFFFLIPIYVGEIASKNSRGHCIGLASIGLSLGMVFIYLLGQTTSFWVLNLICCIIATIYLVVCIFLPETPVFYMMKGKIEEARKTLKLLRKIDYYEEELNELNTKVERSFLSEIKDKGTQKSILLMLGLFSFFYASDQAMSFGVTSKALTSAYSATRFDPFLHILVLEIVQVIAWIVALILVDYKGRKFLLFMSFAVMIFGLIINAIYSQAESFGFSSLNWIPFLAAYILVYAYNSGIIVTFVFFGEIFSTSAKRIIAPLTLVIAFIIQFFITWGLRSLARSDYVSVQLLSLIYILIFIAAIAFCKFVPETKGKSLNQIQKLLNNQRESAIETNNSQVPAELGHLMLNSENNPK